jgi:type I restriction enzyme R subunit
MSALNKAAGICQHHEAARPWRDEISFFQAVQRNIQKYTVSGSGKSDTELNAAIKQIVSGAVSSDGVMDVFGAAGLQRPDISILSNEFLETVKKSEHKNLQLELLKKLINDEIRTQGDRNVVQARKFSEMLERTLLRYQNRTIEAAQVIMELIELAKEMRDAPKRGDALGLTEDELAFYDALADHGDVKNLMGDAVLAVIAHDLVEAIRRSVTIDWTQKEAVRADMRRKVKRLLRKHGYPPDKRAEAVLTVIQQAERVAKNWSRAA